MATVQYYNSKPPSHQLVKMKRAACLECTLLPPLEWNGRERGRRHRSHRKCQQIDMKIATPHVASIFSLIAIDSGAGGLESDPRILIQLCSFRSFLPTKCTEIKPNSSYFLFKILQTCTFYLYTMLALLFSVFNNVSNVTFCNDIFDILKN
jgi:hypothetical protein